MQQQKNCPHCGTVGELQRWGKTKERRIRYRCKACKKTFLNRTGTLRYRTRLSDKEWKNLGKMFALKTSPSGSDAGRYFGKHPYTGQRYFRQLRKVMPLAHAGPPLEGVVELDESLMKKEWIGGAKSRTTGKLKLMVLEDRSMKTMEKFVDRFLTYNATALTDEWKGYGYLRYRRPHYTVCHSKEFVSSFHREVHTNGIEGVWGHAKPLARHTYRGYPTLEGFLREVCFRHNFDHNERTLFLSAKIFPHFTNTSCW